jgi:hypothetical protein
MVMDELALPASLSPPNIPTSFDPIPTEFEQIASSSFEQIPITFEPTHSEKSETESEWTPDQPSVVKTSPKFDDDDEDCDESDDLICVTKQTPRDIIGEEKKERPTCKYVLKMHF